MLLHGESRGLFSSVGRSDSSAFLHALLGSGTRNPRIMQLYNARGPPRPQRVKWVWRKALWFALERAVEYYEAVIGRFWHRFAA
jgi:hypothetical protein